MAQQAPYEVTDTPTDIASAYGPGRYLAQLSRFIQTPHGVLFATSASAPQRMTMPISGATCRNRCLNSLACRACRRG